MDEITSKFSSNSNKLHSIEQGQEKQEKKAKDASQEYLNKCQKLRDDHAEKITNKLIEQGLTLSADFKNRLSKKLLSQVGGTEEIPKEQLEHLGIEGEPTPSEKALILTLREEPAA